MKEQLSKYHRIILLEGKKEGANPLSEKDLNDCRNTLATSSNPDQLNEALLNIRINALEVNPKSRRTLLEAIIATDLLSITEGKGGTLTKLLSMNDFRLKYGLYAFMSVIASHEIGIEYLQHEKEQFRHLVETSLLMMKEVEKGSVIQRFCIAFLQKLSLLDINVPLLIELQTIQACFALLNDSLTHNYHNFCLHYTSSLLVNILVTNSTLDAMEHDPARFQEVIVRNLGLNILAPQATFQTHGVKGVTFGGPHQSIGVLCEGLRAETLR